MARLTFANLKPGMPIKTAEEFNNVLDRRGLFYEVEKEARMNPRTGRPSGFFELYRKDNNAMLGAGVTSRYNVVQNREAFAPMGAIIEECAKTDKIELTKARTWDGGRGAVVSLNVGEMTIGPKSIGDVVKKELNLKNGHGGSALSLHHSTYRLACGNGACSVVKVGVMIRHTETAQSRLQEFYRGFDLIRAQMKKTEATYQVLANTAMTREQRKKFLDTLVPHKGTKKADKNGENMIASIWGYMENADGGLVPQDTAWNALNGVSRFATHDLAVRSQGGKAADESRDQSILEGAGAQLNFKALSLLVKEFSLEAQIDAMIAKMDAAPAAMALAGMEDPNSIESILGSLNLD